jgi:hypothetical protein
LLRPEDESGRFYSHAEPLKHRLICHPEWMSEVAVNDSAG